MARSGAGPRHDATRSAVGGGATSSAPRVSSSRVCAMNRAIVSVSRSAASIALTWPVRMSRPMSRSAARQRSSASSMAIVVAAVCGGCAAVASVFVSMVKPSSGRNGCRGSGSRVPEPATRAHEHVAGDQPADRRKSRGSGGGIAVAGVGVLAVGRGAARPRPGVAAAYATAREVPTAVSADLGTSMLRPRLPGERPVPSEVDVATDAASVRSDRLPRAICLLVVVMLTRS